MSSRGWEEVQIPLKAVWVGWRRPLSFKLSPSGVSAGEKGLFFLISQKSLIFFHYYQRANSPSSLCSFHLQKGKFKQIRQSSLDGQSHSVFSWNGQSQVLGHDGKSHHEWLLYFQNLLEEPQTDVLAEVWKTGYVWESLLGQMVAVLWIK